MRIILLALTALLSLALLAGCGSGDDTASGGSTSSLGAVDDAATPAPPGLYDLPDGRKQALGVLEYRDLEGGFWAVVQAYPGQPTTQAGVVAVLANAEALEVDLEALEGSYVRADGKVLEGASVRMAGPELEVDELAPVSESRVQDQGGQGTGDDY
jgi:hypothetical protein